MQHVGLKENRRTLKDLKHSPQSSACDWPLLYLGLAVGGDLLKRSLLELLHHLPPALALLLLKSGGV